MTNRENNTFRMYLAVQAVIAKFALIWAGLISMDTASKLFNDQVTQLKVYLALQRSIITGYTKTKKKLRKTMATAAMITCRKVRSYAAEKDDDTNMDKLKISFSRLMNTTAADALSDCENILILAKAVPVADMAKIGLSALEISELQAAVDAFALFIATPRVEIGSRSKSTEGVNTYFKLISATLKDRIDNIMANYQLTEPEFYGEYFEARKIVDLQRHTVIEGNVTDENGVDLKKVKVTIIGKDKITDEVVEVFEEMTDKDGNYAKSIINPELDYDLTYELDKYEKVTKTDVDIARGEHELIDVQLVKIPVA